MIKKVFDPEDLGEIDGAFGKLILELAESGHPPDEIFFVGLNNVLEYGFYESPHKEIIIQLGLTSLAMQLERSIPVPADDDDGRVVH